jgi:hypothetical protein
MRRQKTSHFYVPLASTLLRSERRHLASYHLIDGHDLDYPVHHVRGGVRLALQVVEGRLEPHPLLLARQAALAEHD